MNKEIAKSNKINKAAIENILALSPLQEGMLFHYLQEPGSDCYYEQLNLGISGHIDITTFEKAWNFVIDTNEMLRTFFKWEKVENPVQIVLKHHNLKPEYYDFSDIDNNEKAKHLKRLKDKIQQTKFDLRKRPFRVALCRIEKEEYEMMITNHHILYDGWSNGILLMEFFRAYRDILFKHIPQKPSKNRFETFIKYLKNLEKDKQKNFWIHYLEGFTGCAELSVKQRKAKQSIGSDISRGKNEFCYRIPSGLRMKLERFATEHKITIATLFYTAWGILLQKYSNTDDVVFGTTVSGRSPKIKGIEDMVGLFINTSPLRIRRESDDTSLSLLKRIESGLHIREEFEDTSLVDIKSSINWDAQKEFFDSILVVENYPLDMDKIKAVAPFILRHYSFEEMTHYDLTIIIRFSEEIEVNFLYQRSLFEPGVIKQISNHFFYILEELTAVPYKKIEGLDIISYEEKMQLLIDFNRTAAVFPGENTIHGLFGEQVLISPESIAVLGSSLYEAGRKKNVIDRNCPVHLTYSEINERSLRLVVMLQEKGIGADSIVGVRMSSSIELISVLLGILRSGAAYLPIDVDYPAERVDFILKDSDTYLVITDRKEVERKGSSNVSIADGQSSIIDCCNEGNIQLIEIGRIQAGECFISKYSAAGKRHLSLAYIIYTSGSTGTPKGVLVEHNAVVNILKDLTQRYLFGVTDIFLFKTSFLFDVSVTELFGWFLKGSRLIVLGKDHIKDPQRIFDTIEKYQVSLVNFVPSLFNAFIDMLSHQNAPRLSNLRYIFLAGEVLLPELVERFTSINRHVFLENLYGPTEAAVYSSGYSLSTWDGSGTIPIGKPLSNINFLILNKNWYLQPVGVPGELCISGAGVARGYLNKPELSAQKFQVNNLNLRQILNAIKDRIKFSPFSPIYHSGDLARWLTDGNIQFLGRLDNQVKVRGFRIELEEIESRLLCRSDIKEVVASVREGEGNDKYICVYFISDFEFELSELREYLLKDLPDYMIPSYFVRLDKIPLTPNGKVDRKSLPKPELKVGDTFLAPKTDLEKKLAEIWSGVLGIDKEKIGINDNFFHLGGHSLKATVLVSRIYKELKVNVPLPEIFKIVHIRGMAKFITNAKQERFFSIPLVEKREYHILSSAQRRLFVLHRLDERGIAYNMASLWQLEGNLDKEKFELVFQQLIQRHESLRTSFHMVNDEPVQVIHADIGFNIEILTSDLTDCKDSYIRYFIRPFDLSRAPLLRVGLVESAVRDTDTGNQYGPTFLMVDLHHIITDGVSIGILVRDFMELYAGKERPPLKLQYKDYSRWQRWQGLEKSIKHQESYWIKQFSGDIPVLGLPKDYPRPPVKEFVGSSILFEIGREETNALKSLADERGVTLFILLLSIYYVFLSRLCLQEDIVVGTPIAGRRHVDLESIVGMFVNTLALRNFSDGQKQFFQFLGEVKENTIKAFENQDYLYEDLVEQVASERDSGGNPLFDTMFALQNFDTLEIEIPRLKVQSIDFEAIISKFDLSLSVVERMECLVFTFEYSTGLFIKETLRRFTGFFIKTISTILLNPAIRISEIEIIDEEERNRVLYEFNDISTGYPKNKTIPRLFEEQVEKLPDGVAVVGAAFDNCSCHPGESADSVLLTYRELDERSIRLAGWLTENGVLTDTIVGLKVERSIAMIIGIIGILKAKGAYLPIDPEYPEDRINYVLKDSSAKILLTGQFITDFYSGKAYNIYARGTSFPMIPESVHPSSFAYIIYTSGTTGKPKGVAITHANFSPLVHWGYRNLAIGSRDRVIQNLSYFFDWSVWEMFITLTSGAVLVQVSQEVILTQSEYRDFILKQGISVLHITPTQWQYLIGLGIGFDSLDYLFIGAEKLNQDLVIRSLNVVKKSCRLFNMYGPTEATIISAVMEIDRNYLESEKNRVSIPIGRPVGNTDLFILDKFLNVCPMNISGELAIGGDGLARGYINKPELTLEKFYPRNPKTNVQKKNRTSYNTIYSYPLNYLHTDSTIYRTGDLARWLWDGNIEFLGRIDHQVKIRGFRIELGEIENSLLRIKGIKETVVSVRDDMGDEMHICAYFVSDNEIGISELREFMSKELPDYMIPSYFVRLEKIPLTPNGKVDRRALPQPEFKVEERYLAVRNEIERKLVDIWSEVLKVDKEKIGINTSFFDLGGHSLKATILVSRINKELKTKLPFGIIFKYKTPGNLANYIRTPGELNYSRLEAVEKKEYYPLSSAQKRLFALIMGGTSNIVYNLPAIFVIEGNIDSQKLQRALEQLIQRHEILRTSFHIIAGKFVQIIHDDVELKIDTMTTEDREPGHDEINTVLERFIKPFQLEIAPLLRVKLVKISGDRQLLLFDMHHIITDGVSQGIFVKEFQAIYKGIELPHQSIQYKDFSQWQNSKKWKIFKEKQEMYWLEQFKDGIPVLSLPTDFPRPSVRFFRGDYIEVTLEPTESMKLKEMVKGTETTLNMFLMAIYYIVLWKYSGQTDIVVGVTIAARTHPDIENIIGFFVNTLPVRTRLGQVKTFSELLEEVRKTTLEAFENQDYPFNDLVEKLNIPLNPGRNPLFDVAFVVQNMDTVPMEIENTKMSPYPFQNSGSRFDMLMFVREINDKITFSLEYSTELFMPVTAGKFMERYNHILNQVLANLSIKLDDIAISYDLAPAEFSVLSMDTEDFEF